MENKNIIIAILIIIIVILAAVFALMLMPSLTAKESKIVIMGNKTLNEGDNLTVKLTDLNKTPIEKVVVNVAVLDKDGKAVLNKSLTTDSKGKASVNLDVDSGNYTVNATFGGNSNFTANSTSKKISVEKVPEPEVSQQSTSTSQSSSNSKYGSYINDEWVPMTERQYAERYPALYHERTLEEGRYDKYHPEMYEVDRKNGRI